MWGRHRTICYVKELDGYLFAAEVRNTNGNLCFRVRTWDGRTVKYAGSGPTRTSFLPEKNVASRGTEALTSPARRKLVYRGVVKFPGKIP